VLMGGAALQRCTKGGSHVASAAEVPQRLKPGAQQRLYAGLEACSTLWQMIATPGSSFKLTTTIS
jgi:hypothetical protein